MSIRHGGCGRAAGATARDGIRSIVLLAGLAALGAAVLPAGQAVAAPLFVDDFNDNSLGQVWTSERGGLPSLQETNSRLEVTLPGGSSGYYYYADIRLSSTLTGNFDAQVDFAVLAWPASNGVRIGLVAAPAVGYGAGIERISRGTSEYSGVEHYDTDIGGISANVLTTSSTGTIRLARTGTIVSGYYWNAGSWALVGTTPWVGDDVQLALSGWSHDSVFAHQDVRFAFDNFQITSGQFIPEPATLTLLALAGATIIYRRKRR